VEKAAANTGRVADFEQAPISVPSFIIFELADAGTRGTPSRPEKQHFMLDNRYDLSPILANYPSDCQIAATVPPGALASGFSGSLVWQLHTRRGILCLRCWPAEFSDTVHLRWIHSILDGVFQAGFRLVPVPTKTSAGATFVYQEGFLWQLEPWLRGEADDDSSSDRRPSAVRVTAALTALAEFHAAGAADSVNCLPDGPAPGILRRLAELNALQFGGLDRLASAIAVHGSIWPELADRAGELLKTVRLAANYTTELLERATKWNVRIRPCIRDIHRQHVLFEGDSVTGIVDFGAMQFDHVATDIARLLGSLAGDDFELWRAGLGAYQRLQPLTEQELLLIDSYDKSGLLLSGVHWLQWVFVDGRDFVNRQGVLARFDEILVRLIRSVDQRPASASIIV
jgi:Ser/Thr protein kinase RdoA (MazF antagonist)